jgi:hypothetical protein
MLENHKSNGGSFQLIILEIILVLTLAKPLKVTFKNPIGMLKVSDFHSSLITSKSGYPKT